MASQHIALFSLLTLCGSHRMCIHSQCMMLTADNCIDS